MGDEKRRYRGTTEALDEAAREHRRKPTPAERVLWGRLRRKQLHGLKFRRQHAVGSYILDFYCPEHRLVVEVDGDVHARQREYDDFRTQWLEQYGYRVIRFHNNEILNDIDGVLSQISKATGTAS